MALFTDPSDPRANSYVSLDDANQILEQRLYTDAWDDASQSPGGRGYLVDDPGATLAPGSTVIPLKDGEGGFTAANRVSFQASQSTEYKIDVDAPAPVVSVTLSAPGLVAPIPLDGEQFIRWTPNEKESALIWATSVLDCYMDWNGTKTGNCNAQVLRWPRTGVIDYDGCQLDANTIPQALKDLTAETALYLLTRNLSTDPALLGLGFSKAEIPGPIKVEVDSRQVIPIISNYLRVKGGYLGSLVPDAAGQNMRSLPLARV